MSAQGPQQRCAHCGANLSLDDLRGTSCRYCGTVLPHHARAAEQAALVNQVLNQQLQARGLPPPATPIVPYQYGAPPGAPGAPPGGVPYLVDTRGIEQAARRSVAVFVIAGVVVLFVTMMLVGVAFWLFLV